MPEDVTPERDAVAGGSAADKIFARVGNLDDFLRGLAVGSAGRDAT